MDFSPEPIHMLPKQSNADRQSVCASTQSEPRAQHRGRNLPESEAQPGKKLPTIAAHAVAPYNKPDDPIVDPMCIGVGLVEMPLARGGERFPAFAARMTACAAPNGTDADAMDQARSFHFAVRPFDLTEAASQGSDYRVPTLMKSSYRLPAAAVETVDEQQRSYSDSVTALGLTPSRRLDRHPSSGLQA